jgi:peptidylprolyl isomerase
MLPAAKNDVVKVHYTGRLADGTVFDTSRDKKPLHFILGANEVIPGFDEAVTGMVRGEHKTVTIPPERAYGPVLKNLVEEVDRELLPGNLDLRVGASLEVTRQDGSVFRVAVVGINEKTVTLDANHPLAGKELTFDIEMLEVSKKPRV